MSTASRLRLAVALCLIGGCSLIWPAKYKFEEAEALEKDGKYPEAVVLYELVFTKYPKSREALEALARAAAVYEERLNNWQKAAAYLQDLRTRTEGKPQFASVLLRLGRVLEHAGTPYKDSLETYGVLCRNCASAPEAVSALVAQGRLHESMQDWAAAKGVYEDALARYGKSAEAPTIWVRLEAVWQFEAMGLYYAGEVEHGVTLAQEAMKKGITVDEVRNGLEALLGRYKKAKDLWQAEAASVVREEGTVSDRPAPGHFVYRYDRGPAPSAPEGWAVVLDAKRKTLKLTVSGTGKPWTWKSPAEAQVTGYWFSPDGRRLGWIAKSRSGKKRTLNALDLRTRKGTVVMTDPAGTVLGDVMAFLPYAAKVVFPYGNYMMVSDLRGGNRTSFPPEVDLDRRDAFKGRQVESVATTADGLELLLITDETPAKKGKAGSGAADRRIVYRKVGLGIASF